MVALRNVPPFLGLVWRTSPSLTVWTLVVRLLRALLPVITLYVGKLIIDEVVLVAGGGAAGGRNFCPVDSHLRRFMPLQTSQNRSF